MSRINQAELAIARILEQLEMDTGSVVEEISLDDIDVTSLESDRQVIARRVRLELKRLPGTSWYTGNE